MCVSLQIFKSEWEAHCCLNESQITAEILAKFLTVVLIKKFK